jgi:hypothetical protein
VIVRLGTPHEVCLGKVSSHFLTLRVTIKDTVCIFITIFFKEEQKYRYMFVTKDLNVILILSIYQEVVINLTLSIFGFGVNSIIL